MFINYIYIYTGYIYECVYIKKHKCMFALLIQNTLTDGYAK